MSTKRAEIFASNRESFIVLFHKRNINKYSFELKLLTWIQKFNLLRYFIDGILGIRSLGISGATGGRQTSNCPFDLEICPLQFLLVSVCPLKILKLYTQMNFCRFDFGVWIWNTHVINRDIKNRLKTHLTQA